MRVLDWFRWKTKKLRDWDDFHLFEMELNKKIREFYPEPKYHFTEDGIVIGVSLTGIEGNANGIVIQLEYYDNKSTDWPVECQYIYHFNFNKTFANMIRRYNELYDTRKGECEIHDTVRNELLKCKSLSDLKNINVLSVIGFGAKCVITSVDLLIDEDEFPELVPEGIIIRWKNIVGYYDNPPRVVLTDLPEDIINDWNSIDSSTKMTRIYRCEEDDWEGLCYAVENTDEERDWILE